MIHPARCLFCLSLACLAIARDATAQIWSPSPSGSQVAAGSSVWFNTLPAAKRADIQWSADTETGDASQWDNGHPWVSGDNSWQIINTPVHSGSYAISSTIETSQGASGVRWPRRNVPGDTTLPTEAYYSTWVFLPNALSSDWFTLMQWKTWLSSCCSDPVKSLNLVNQDGALYLGLYDFVGAEGQYDEFELAGGGMRQIASIPFPTARWVHLEAFYKWDKTANGSVIAYQDGVEVLRQTSTITQYDYADEGLPRQWAVNNYGGQLAPSTFTLYFDDAAISRSRLSEAIVPLLGDYNRDGTVNAADYTTWRNSLGQMGSGLAADGNTNGRIDAGDYTVWKSNFGHPAFSGAESNLPIPEPATLIVALLGTLVIWASRRSPRPAFCGHRHLCSAPAPASASISSSRRDRVSSPTPSEKC